MFKRSRKSRGQQASKTSRKIAAPERLESRDLLAATPQLVADIAVPVEMPHDPRDLLVVGGTLFFSARDSAHGRELWKIDNATGRAVMVRDVNPGPEDGIFQPGPAHIGLDGGEFEGVGSTLYFRGYDGSPGADIWKSDGTTVGTALAVDLTAVTGGSTAPYELTNFNGQLFFTSFTSNPFEERLYQSNGTTAGTHLASGAAVTSPQSLTVSNGYLWLTGIEYFSFTNTGRELFYHDGAITRLVGDIMPGAASSDPFGLTPTPVGVAFSAIRPNEGRQPFEGVRTLGSATIDYLTFRAPDADNFVNVNGVVYFSAAITSGFAAERLGNEVWRWARSENSINLVHDVNPGQGSSFPRDMTNAGGVLVFTAQGSDGVRRVYRRDSSGNLVIESAFSLDPREVTYAGGKVYFQANDALGLRGIEAEIFDPFTGTNYSSLDINPGLGNSYPHAFTEFNGHVYFSASDGTDFKLWRITGYNSSNIAIREQVPVRSLTDSTAQNMATLNNGMTLFTADDGIHGRELWVTSGAGATLVQDITPGAAGTDIRTLTSVGNFAYFFASDPVNGRELWRTDGTSAGTYLVKPQSAGGGDAPYFLTNVNGTLFFTAWAPDAGRELWRSDGTMAGTRRVKDVFPGLSSSYPSGLTNVNGTLYFSAYEPSVGIELYRSDGTEAGTHIVADVTLGTEWSYPQNLTNVAGRLFFTAHNGAQGRELYVSDGATTSLARDIAGGSASSDIRTITDVNGTAYFFASDGQSGAELWKSDGTEAGTLMVNDIVTSGGSFPYFLTNVNGTLYFTVWTPDDAGRELWRSDGTAGGTDRVKNIRAGIQSSYPGGLTNVRGTLYFAADDGVTGRELWRSDGTEAGTRPVANLNPGGVWSDPQSLFNADGRLYFTANDGVRGRELWTIDPLGDFDGNLIFDGGDVLAWQRQLGSTVIPGAGADADFDGVVTSGDLDEWFAQIHANLGGGGASPALAVGASAHDQAAIDAVFAAIDASLVAAPRQGFRPGRRVR